MSAQLWTLEAAAAELARRKCLTSGHDTTMIFKGMASFEPVAMLCDRCGRTWTVTPTP
ncbi:hypothetical protein [Nonomuraea turkmeniaca]|uniref:hypothetical protein n=1 Tax=Nonomuraea turkmeniaca TaxID=103838 RepID=UPI00147767A9|nr:hypothetical protein [Nonomuraea turkmeniaca]